MIRWFFAASASICCLASGCSSPQPASASEVKITPGELLVTSKDKERKDAIFKVANMGSRTLNGLTVAPSCECVEVSPTTLPPLGPGAEVPVHASMVADQTEPKRESVYVLDDSQTSLASADFTTQLISPFTSSFAKDQLPLPNLWRHSPGDKTEAIQAEIPLKASISSLEIKPEVPWIRFKTFISKSTLHLWAQADETAPEGPFAINSTVTYRDPMSHQISLLWFSTVKSKIVVEPSAVSFGYIRKGSLSKEKIRILGTWGRNERFTAPPNIHFTKISASKLSDSEVEVTILYKAMDVGEGHGNITIRTSSGEVIQIPWSSFVQA